MAGHRLLTVPVIDRDRAAPLDLEPTDPKGARCG